MAAIMIGLGQAGTSVELFLPGDTVLLGLVFIIGLFTFTRLVERRMRCVEYLCAINWLPHYFVERDPQMENNISWQPFDNIPGVEIKGTTLGGLCDIITVRNSLVLGFMAGLSLIIFEPGTSVGWVLPAGLAAAAACWGGMHVYKKSGWTEEKRIW